MIGELVDKEGLDRIQSFNSNPWAYSNNYSTLKVLQMFILVQ